MASTIFELSGKDLEELIDLQQKRKECAEFGAVSELQQVNEMILKFARKFGLNYYDL